MSSSVKVGGNWQPLNSSFVKVGGSWSTVDRIFVKVNGAWVQAFGNFNDATGGNTINTFTESGKTMKFHLFSGSGTFTVTKSVKPFDLIVAGGGGGGGRDQGGGGGAGGFIELTSANLPVSSYSIVIGAGGAQNTAGSNSSIVISGTTYTANGGGRGAGFGSPTGGSGGSGGGGENGAGGARTQTLFNQTLLNGTLRGYGNAGGSSPATVDDSGGGGGAGGAGQPPPTRARGLGLDRNYNGTTITYSRGGFGCGGGLDGQANTGQGGDGTAWAGTNLPGRPGGSGVVVIKYEI